MTQAFFLDWPLWEKLVFLLACGISATGLAGGMKVVYSHWRLRKYARTTEREADEQMLHRQMSQRGQVPEVQRSQKIPFGIRALECGLEVEGVWISRPATPDSGVRDLSVRSLTSDHAPHESPRLDLGEQPVNVKGGRSSSANAREVQVTRNIDVVQSSERDSGGTIPASDESKMPRKRRYPPLSFLKYSHNPYLFRNPQAINSLEGMEATYRASTSNREPYELDFSSSDDSSPRSSSGSGVSDRGKAISGAAPNLLNAQPRPRPRHRSLDFQMLDSHRLSQAAETGQLTPRTRKTSHSVGAKPHRSSCDDARLRKAGADAPAQMLGKPLSNSRLDAMPPAVRRASMPDVTPFSQFVQSTAPSPASLTSFEWRWKNARRHSDVESVSHSTPSSPDPLTPPTERVELPADTKSTKSPRQSFEKIVSRHASVLRGHGTGFEILKPGSLQQAAPAEMGDSSIDRQRGAPPVSLQNYAGSRSHSANSGKKLQKKRGMSFDSQVSSTSGGSGSRGRLSVA